MFPYTRLDSNDARNADATSTSVEAWHGGEIHTSPVAKGYWCGSSDRFEAGGGVHTHMRELASPEPPPRAAILPLDGCVVVPVANSLIYASRDDARAACLAAGCCATQASLLPHGRACSLPQFDSRLLEQTA